MDRKRAEDRSEPPVGFEVTVVCRDADGNEIGEEEAQRDELAEARYVPRLVMLTARNREGAVAHCWNIYDAMRKRAYREVLQGLVDAECFCCSKGMRRDEERDGVYVHRDEDGSIWSCYANRTAVRLLNEVTER
jgi:hypothetical protein